MKKHKMLILMAGGLAASIGILCAIEPHYGASLLVNEFHIVTTNTQNVFNIALVQGRMNIHRLPAVIESVFSLTAAFDFMLKFIVSAVAVSAFFSFIKRFDFSPKLSAGNERPVVYSNYCLNKKAAPAQTSQIEIINTVNLNT